MYKNIVHEKFPNGIKKSGLKKNSGMANKTAREMRQLSDANSKGQGELDLFKGICKLVEKGCVGKT
jgi:hypothetical protein